jgi:hypothetical protein
MLSITSDENAATPRTRITLAGRIDGDAVADAFLRLYREDPAAVGYDRLFDLTAYECGFEVRHLQRIAAGYRAPEVPPARPARTAFVTRDPNFEVWAQTMGYQFTGRCFRVFRSFEEAERFLDEPEPAAAAT